MDRPSDATTDVQAKLDAAKRYSAQLRTLTGIELLAEMSDVNLPVSTVAESQFGALAILKPKGRMNLVQQLAQDEYKRRAFTFGSGLAMQLSEPADGEVRPQHAEEHAPIAAAQVARLEADQADARQKAADDEAAARAVLETPVVPPPTDEPAHQEPDGADVLHDETH